MAFLFPQTKGYAQTCQVKGLIIDSVYFQHQNSISVQLMALEYENKIAVTSTDERGYFSIMVKPGRYAIALSNVLLEAYKDTFLVDKQEIDIGTIHMKSKQNVLEEIIVRERRAVLRKGDTTEYVADSFLTGRYANVDEIIKLLPGIGINHEGNITAQGETITQILVDGEAFFSADPMEVARMLRAAAIDKIQVYNEKSEQSRFSNIDDGQRIKTINLVLKDNAKQGYFGKLKLAGGLPGYYENQGILNLFTPGRKISAFGNISNTNAGQMNGMGSDQNMITSFGQRGLPQNKNGGFHYDSKSKDKKFLINGNYQYRNTILENVLDESTQYIMPDSQYRSTRNIQSIARQNTHTADVESRYIIDTSSYIKLKLNYQNTDGNSTINAGTVTNDASGTPLNTQNQDQQTKERQQDVAFNMFYGKRFKKTGRNLSMEVNGNRQTVDNDWLVATRSRFGSLLSDTIHERKDATRNNQHLNARLNYTDALSGFLFAEINYQADYNASHSEQLSYDLLKGSETSGVLDTALSSHYRYGVMTNRGGARLTFKQAKWNVVAGANVSNASYTQQDFLGTRNYSYSIFNIAPSASFSYERKNSSLRANYSGQSRQPTIEQIQPLVQNTDPLNIFIGNPLLRQEFRHQLDLYGNSFQAKHNTNYFLNASFSMVQSAISLSYYTDSQGRRTNQYINVKGNSRFSLGAGYSKDVEVLKLKTSFVADASWDKNVALVNNVFLTFYQRNYSGGFTILYTGNSRFNFSNAANLTYSHNNNSPEQVSIQPFVSYNQTTSLNVMPVPRLQINTAVRWTLRNKVDEADLHNNVISWNAFVSYTLLANQSLKVTLSAQDILNQNNGFSRIASDNTITYSSYATIKRYALLSIQWNFTHTPKEDHTER